MFKIPRLLVCMFLFALAISMTNCTSAAPVLPGGLIIEEHALQGPPQTEPLTFVPLDGTQEEILQKHAAQRDEVFPDSIFPGDDMSITAELNGNTLAAREFYENSGQGYVTVASGGKEIYRIDVGEGSPITALRRFEVYAGHWVLEAARVSNTETVEGDMTSVHSFSLGQIVVDGELLNENRAYEEAFGFQTINGKPFYFYQSGGKIGISYDGQETMQGYEEIPHYGCCSAGEVNPRIAQDMVAFFARKGKVWYYVEIGVFDQ